MFILHGACVGSQGVCVSLAVLLPLFQEVDNWTALVADVDEVFASQDVGRMAAKIQGMQHSLVRAMHLTHVYG